MGLYEGFIRVLWGFGVSMRVQELRRGFQGLYLFYRGSTTNRFYNGSTGGLGFRMLQLRREVTLFRESLWKFIKALLLLG